MVQAPMGKPVLKGSPLRGARGGYQTLPSPMNPFRDFLLLHLLPLAFSRAHSSKLLDPKSSIIYDALMFGMTTFKIKLELQDNLACPELDTAHVVFKDFILN